MMGHIQHSSLYVTYVHHTYVHTYQQQRFHLVASFHQQFYSAAPSNEDQVVLYEHTSSNKLRTNII